MNRRAGAWAVVLFGLMGCMQPQIRSQAGEDIDKDAEVKTIGDVTVVDNADVVQVSGVALVTGLNGTGAPAPNNDFRKVVENELHTQNIPNVREILNSKDNSVVLVTGFIPAGARNGDLFDIEVSLPEGSKTTSLNGGYLQECRLFTYDTAHNVVPTTTRPDQLLKGILLGKAKGPLLVGFGDGDEAAQQKRGRIWDGGTYIKPDRPFFLMLNSDQQYYRVAIQAANRINETFQGPYHGPNSAVAEAKNKSVVHLRVPAQYKLNIPHFLRVVRLIPLQELPPPGSRYRKKLEEDLLDPAHTMMAALRLEALGSESIPTLKRGLESEHVLVRFSAAEALAYLGSSAGGEELAKLVKAQPMLRAYCLTALASLDETVCHYKLEELMSDPSAETRFGAFRALRTLRPNDEAVQGEYLNDTFWLHQVAPKGPSLVHVSTTKRAEVVLFGEEPYLEPPFSFQAGAEFTITASADDDKCTIGRFSTTGGIHRKQCSLKLSDVLRQVTELGGGYPDVVDLLRRADNCRCLSCRVTVDALPLAPSVFQIARAGQAGKERNESGEDELLATDKEVLDARADFSATPTLFEAGRARQRESIRNQRAERD
jgi:hypothetical protein